MSAPTTCQNNITYIQNESSLLPLTQKKTHISDAYDFATACQSTSDISAKYCNNNSIYQSRPDSESSEQQRQLRGSSGGATVGGGGGNDGANNNIALIKIGEASALPVMLCGILQNRELFYQQAHEHQKQFLAQSQSSPDYFKDHRHSLSSAYTTIRCEKKKQKKAHLKQTKFLNQI